MSKRTVLTAALVLVAAGVRPAVRAGRRRRPSPISRSSSGRSSPPASRWASPRVSARSARARRSRGRRSDRAQPERVRRHPRRADPGPRADRVARHLRAADLADPLLPQAVRRLGRRDAERSASFRDGTGRGHSACAVFFGWREESAESFSRRGAEIAETKGAQSSGSRPSRPRRSRRTTTTLAALLRTADGPTALCESRRLCVRPASAAHQSAIPSAELGCPARGPLGLYNGSSREVPLLLPARRGAARRARARPSRASRCASCTEKTAARHLAGRRAAVRDPGARDLGADPVRQPADLGAAGVRAGVHGLQLHRAAARGRAPHDLRAAPSGAPSALLGLLYAVPSGISASQFTRWHLDHHAELGSDEDDPKRHHLSPKVNARWYKLLYCTPALFPIYFRAARREASTYPEALQRAIDRERKVSMAAHLSAHRARSGTLFGFYAALRTSIIPVFFIFPIAFTLNRLGQHYDIDPADPAKWGTLMRGPLVLGLRVPELELPPRAPLLSRACRSTGCPRLQRALVPFYEQQAACAGRRTAGWSTAGSSRTRRRTPTGTRIRLRPSRSARTPRIPIAVRPRS